MSWKILQLPDTERVIERLSRMKGNFHVRFLEEGERVIALSYSTIIHSLKNEIEIKPLRVWSDASIYGAVIIGFIAQLFISLMRYEFKELKHKSTKFIKKSLLNLTVTVDFLKLQAKKYIYANFDAINTLILSQNRTI